MIEANYYDGNGPLPDPEPLIRCPFCDEWIKDDELAGPCNGNERGMHHECGVRMLAGSVGHQLGICACYGKSDTSEYGLTKRQAAQNAARLWRSMHDEPPEVRS